MNLLFHNATLRAGGITALALAALLGSGLASAAGTAANTDITNSASLTYSVGAVAQTAIGSSPTGNTSGAGTATSFKVDNKINLLVTTQGSNYITVVPGQTAVVSTFTVLNSGNSVQDFLLAFSNKSSGTAAPAGYLPAGGTDSFDPAACSVKVESGLTAGFQAAEDTATYIDELAADISKTVFVVCNIPAGQVNNDIAVISLTATAAVGGTAGTQGIAVVETVGADTAGVDIVFADIAGSDDAARSGSHSSRDAFRVVTATLTVMKTVAVVCDPFNGNVNPKNIPGTFVRYTISVANTGASTATLTNISDILNTTLVTFDPNLITGAGAVPATNCSSATGAAESVAGSGFKVTMVNGTRAGFPKYFTTTSSADGADLTGGNTVNVDFSLVLPNEAGYLPGNLKATETVSVIFQVKIN